jgi:hypothetical protein
MENNNLHLKCFNRFIDYVNKNTSSIEIKFKDNNIIFIDKHYYTKFNKINWYMDNNNFTINEMIEYFFLGYNMSDSKKILSIFEYVEHWFRNCAPDLLNLLKHFGKPSCLEELIIKMDLMGI